MDELAPVIDYKQASDLSPDNRITAENIKIAQSNKTDLPSTSLDQLGAI